MLVAQHTNAGFPEHPLHTALWRQADPAGGALLVLGTASVSLLGYEHDRSEPVLRSWNG